MFCAAYNVSALLRLPQSLLSTLAGAATNCSLPRQPFSKGLPSGPFKSSLLHQAEARGYLKPYPRLASPYCLCCLPNPPKSFT